MKVFAKDWDINLNEIREIVGFSPQKFILYNKLTIEEHLKFFAAIKGVENYEDEIKNLLFIVLFL